MASLLKIVNPAVAKELAAVGFAYMTETLNGKPVFVFSNTEEIKAYIETIGVFSQEVLYSNKLSF